jgi:hypothetical protein
VANVVVQNKLPQVINISIVDGQGSTEEVRLAPFAKSSVVDDSKLTDYTRSLAQKGHVVVRPAS